MAFQMRSIVALLSVVASQSANVTVTRFIKKLGGIEGHISSASFSPDGSKVVAAGLAADLKVWVLAGDPSTWGFHKTFETGFRSINFAGFSPDSSRLATADNGGNLALWAVGGDPSTWGPLGKLHTSTPSECLIPAVICAADFSPDGSKVATGDSCGSLNLWQVQGDPSTWRLLKTVGTIRGTIQSLKFSPDGFYAVTGDTLGNVIMWVVGGDPSQWGLPQTIGHSSSWINSVSFSPDGSNVVSGDKNGNLTLWQVAGDPSTWGLLKTVGNSGSSITSVSLSADGSRIVTGDMNANLNMWAVRGDPSTWGLIQTVGSTSLWIGAVNFSPDGSMVVSGDDYGDLKLWAVGGDATTGQLLKTVSDSSSQIYSADFSPDGSKVVTGDGSGHLNLWEVDGDPANWGQLKSGCTSGVLISAAKFSPDGSMVVTGDSTGTLNLWQVLGDQAAWQPQNLWYTGSQIYSIIFSPDGSRVAAVDGKGDLNLWAVRGDNAWTLLRTLGTNGSSLIYAADFSPDGSRVITGDQEGNLNLWQVGGSPSTWRLLSTLVSYLPLYSVKYSPDGSRVMTADNFGEIHVWQVRGDDASTWYPLGSPLFANRVASVKFSPDGSRIVTGDLYGNVSLWSVGGDPFIGFYPSTWGVLRTVGYSSSWLNSVSFSLDGSRLVTGDNFGNLKVWQVGGSPSWGLPETAGTSGSVLSDNFSGDGSWVVTDNKRFPGAGLGYAPLSWATSSVSDLLIVVNQYPATLESFTEMASCGSELYGGAPYEVCNVTVTQPSSMFLRRSAVQAVEELLSQYLPAVRMNFTADMVSLAPLDLPIPWRTLALALNKTFQCTAPDLFSALGQLSPFLEELDISGTLVSGAIATRSPIRRLQAANAPITNVSADFFSTFVELLDLRNTPFLAVAGAALNTDGLVFRHGVPACSEPFPGHVVNGTLCKLCQHPGWYFDGRPSSQKCLPCLSQSGVLEVAGLLGLVLLIGALGYAFRARIKLLGHCVTGLRPRVQFLEKKGKLTIFAYQQLSQLGYLANPLPPKTESLASAANVFNFQWLSNSAFAACTLGLGYHVAWLLCLLEVALLMVIAMRVGLALGVSQRESFIFAHSLTIMTVATKTLPLFDCDERLMHTSLPLSWSVAKPYLRVDYSIDCSHLEHKVYEGLGAIVLVVYCLLIPVLQTRQLYRARSVINPPLHGQLLAHLAAQRYLDVARDELGRLPEAEVFPSRSLDQVQIAEIAAIRVRNELLKHNEHFKNEAEMASDYVPSTWWWFSVPTLSRVLLAGVYVCQAQDQAFLGCALCMLLALAVLHFRPHLRQSDNQHEMLCQASVALAFALNSVQPANPGPGWLALAIGTLICLPAMSLLYHIGQHFNPASRSRRRVDDLVMLATSQVEAGDHTAHCPEELGVLSPAEGAVGTVAVSA